MSEAAKPDPTVIVIDSPQVICGRLLERMQLLKEITDALQDVEPLIDPIDKEIGRLLKIALQLQTSIHELVKFHARAEGGK
jgi:hypothetical protein